MRNKAAIAILCVSILSCVSTGTTVLNPSSKRPPISPDKVVIYTSADKVKGQYEELAILSSQGDYTMASDETFYESFRKEAAKIGANGVIIAPIEDPTTGQKVGSAVLGALLIPNTMGNRKTQATAIYVFAPPPSPDEILPRSTSGSGQPIRMDKFEALVRPGMTRDEMITAVGPPTASHLDVDGHADSSETATYVGSAGTTFVVMLKNKVIASLMRK